MLLTLIQKEAFLRYALRSSVEHFNHDLSTASKILILKAIKWGTRSFYFYTLLFP